MHHAYIDQMSLLESPIHRLDPRAKIISLAAFILFVVLTPVRQVEKFPIYFLLLLGLIVVSRLPFGYLFRRSLLVLPFVLVIAMFIPFIREGETIYAFRLAGREVTISDEGAWVCANIFVKSYLAMLAMLALASTTRFPDLLRGLEKLGVPGLIIMILSFLYRYIFVLIDQVMRMRQAAASRNMAVRPRAGRLRVAAGMIGTHFIRTYEKSERIYQAMASRGFDGEVRSLTHLAFGRRDLAFSTASIALCAANCLWAWGGG